MTEQPEQTLASSATAEPPESAAPPPGPPPLLRPTAASAAAAVLRGSTDRNEIPPDRPAPAPEAPAPPAAPPAPALVPDTPEPAENPHTAPADGGSPYDDPAFQKEHADGTQEQVEGWLRDWRIRVDAIQAQTDLSRSEAMQYLALLQMGAIRGMLQGFQSLWNSESFQAKRQTDHELALMERQIAMQKLNITDDGQQGKVLVPGWKIQ